MKWVKKIIMVGNSSAILIPTDLMKHIGLEIGDEVTMQDDEGKHGKFVSFWKKVDKLSQEDIKKLVEENGSELPGN